VSIKDMKDPIARKMLVALVAIPFTILVCFSSAIEGLTGGLWEVVSALKGAWIGYKE
jgi:hypothetical protein